MEKEYNKRPLIEEEDKYTFLQSSQISSQCGLIGSLRSDFGSEGNGFYSNWFDYRKDLKTNEFKTEFDEVINSLREEGDILNCRAALATYCHYNLQAKMSDQYPINAGEVLYGIRVDSENYSYLFRLNPRKNEYNVYCYCYKKAWLDDHIKQARRGIRFIDTDYNVLFKIPDGDQICIKIGKDAEYRKCRYIDEYHFEFGDTIYHICEFAEKIKGIGAKVVPYRYDLPSICYAVHNESGKIIIIRKGETGYYDPGIITKDSEESRNMADEYNAIRGISKAQAAAMYWGSLFGFETPGADPKSYDMNGNLIRKGEC